MSGIRPIWVIVALGQWLKKPRPAKPGVGADMSRRRARMQSRVRTNFDGSGYRLRRRAHDFGGLSHAASESPALAYTADGKLVFPKDYRTWVYLSTGVDMAYLEGPPPTAAHLRLGLRQSGGLCRLPEDRDPGPTRR